MANYILMDIEGTTTEIDFVHKVLFPFARKHLSAYLAAHGEEPAVQSALAETASTVKAEQVQEQGHEPSQEQLTAALLSWIDQDRKHPALKRLQGMIWEDGYRQGSFQSHLYEDVLPSWQAWLSQGKRLGIYSSGSVQAQKLLFGHTVHGDLNGMLSHYFDTAVGPKREPGSYRAIAAALAQDPQEVHFLSDIPEELDAARAAGMLTTQLVRPGTKPCQHHPTAASFSEV